MFQYMCIYIYFFDNTCDSMYDTLHSSAANEGDNIVSVDPDGNATPGATKQLLPPVRVFQRYI